MQGFSFSQALILMICYFSYNLCLDGILLGDNVLQCNEVVRGRQTGAYGCKTPQPCQFFRFNDRSIHPCLCLFFQALFWRWDWKNWIEENTEFLFHKLVLIHPGHKCWHQVLFKWPQNALRPVVLVHSMHSCCRSTRKKRDRCNSPSEEGDRSPSYSSSCLWWWWTITVIVLFASKAGWCKTRAICTSDQQKSEWADKNLIYDHDKLALIWLKEGWGCLGLGVWHCSSLGYEWE